jgi:hypothetical protein
MNRPFALLGFLLATLASALAADPERVLFIGNSYTSVNKLPDVFAEVVKSAGRKVPVIKSQTPGGQTLKQHLTVQPKSLAAIDEGKWDVVVLQGQSQEPALAEVSPAIRADFVDSAAALCQRVRAKSPQVRIVFYETWARHPDFWNGQGKDYNANVGKDPAEMQARLRLWYEKVAKANDALVAPVGDAWERNYLSKQPLHLHVADHSHPDFKGTYLAALVMYKTIYQPKDVAVAYHGKLSDAEAKALQALVK